MRLPSRHVQTALNAKFLGHPPVVYWRNDKCRPMLTNICPFYFLKSLYLHNSKPTPTLMLWQAVARLRADVDELQLLNRKV